MRIICKVGSTDRDEWKCAPLLCWVVHCPMSAPTFECTADGVPLKKATPAEINNNPGSYEELHRKCKDVFPTCFEGARVMVQKGLSSHFQVNHTLSVSPVNTSYRFGATFVGDKAASAGEAFPVLLGDTDVDGNTSATILHQFGDRWRLKLQSQVRDSKLTAAQGTMEYRGRLATLGVTVANLDVVGESGILVAQLLRRFTSRLDIGTELVYQYGKQIPGNQISVLSCAARYNGEWGTASGSLGRSGVQLCYHHKQVDALSFGVDFESNFLTKEAVTTFAYQAEIPHKGVTMRASIDTNWSVGGVLEKKLEPSMPLTFAISGLMNHAKTTAKFGIGLILG